MQRGGAAACLHLLPPLPSLTRLPLPLAHLPAHHSNEEYDLLKEELLWSGSKVAVLSTGEKRLLEARMAYKRGSPIMSDADYDALKASLAGSPVFSLPRSGPVCSLAKDPSKRGRTEGEAKPDLLRMGVLAMPAPLVVSRRCPLAGSAEQPPMRSAWRLRYTQKYPVAPTPTPFCSHPDPIAGQRGAGRRRGDRRQPDPPARQGGHRRLVRRHPAHFLRRGQRHQRPAVQGRAGAKGDIIQLI